MMYSGVIAKEDISDFSIKSDHMLEEFLDKAAKEMQAFAPIYLRLFIKL